jgi:hypothetical protein
VIVDKGALTGAENGRGRAEAASTSAIGKCLAVGGMDFATRCSGVVSFRLAEERGAWSVERVCLSPGRRKSLACWASEGGSVGGSSLAPAERLTGTRPGLGRVPS